MRGGFWLLKLESPEVGEFQGWFGLSSSEARRIWFPCLSALPTVVSTSPKAEGERTGHRQLKAVGAGMVAKPLREEARQHPCACPSPLNLVAGYLRAPVEGDEHWAGCWQPSLHFCGRMFSYKDLKNSMVFCYWDYFLKAFIRKTCFQSSSGR